MFLQFIFASFVAKMLRTVGYDSKVMRHTFVASGAKGDLLTFTYVYFLLCYFFCLPHCREFRQQWIHD